MKPNLPRDYPALITRSLARLDSMPLLATTGRDDPEFAGALRKGGDEALFKPAAVPHPSFARLCVAGLWLANDCLDECHTIAQSDEGPEGSWWHAILHRREGDYSNSKYWYRRVGSHAEFQKIGRWDPFDFVDRCEAAARGAARGEGAGLVQLQAREFMVLFEYCYRKATDG